MKKVWQQTVKQAEAWKYLNDDVTTEILFGGGAGGGKTQLGCGWLISSCGAYPGTRWVMARETLKRLKETTLRSFFEVCSMWGLRAGIDFIYNANDGIIKFPGFGSEIFLKELFAYPSDPNFESLGSLEITGSFIDEVSEVSEMARNVLKTRIRYKLDEYNLTPKQLMTCNPTKKWAYREFYKPWKEGTLKENMRFVQALAVDNPFISKHYIENLKQLPPGATKERLLYGNWEYDDDPARILEHDEILDLFTNEDDWGDTWYLSCDVARFGQDQTVICIWQGLYCRGIKMYPKTAVNEIVEELQRLCERFKIRRSHVVVDEDGVGGGVVDTFKGCKGFVNNSKAIQGKHDVIIKNYANLKTQCYFEFARLTKSGKIRLYTNSSKVREMIIEELGQIKQKDIDKDGKISLIPKQVIKQNIGRSPDISDALMMRMFFELKKVNIFKPILV
jgi:phage terminase large subunit